jgi:hypothetical protein
VPVQLRATWGAFESELENEVVALSHARGFDKASLAQARRELKADVSLEPGSVGKGAAGYGISLVVQVAEHVLTDMAALLALGAALRNVIRRVSATRDRAPAVLDEIALAAVAADEIADRLAEARWVGTVPITARPGVGTDDRDVWAVCFSDASGLAIVVFVSPSGAVLSVQDVRPLMWWDGTQWRTGS